MNEIRSKIVRVNGFDDGPKGIVDALTSLFDSELEKAKIEGGMKELNQIANMIADPLVTKLSLLRIVRVRYSKLKAQLQPKTGEQ
jgi:hypothetical protein